MEKNRQFKVVAISGHVRSHSRTLALIHQIIASLNRFIPLDAHIIETRHLAQPLVISLQGGEPSAELKEEIGAIESADLLIAASPVYRASYTGIFKLLFDFVHHEALTGKPVLLAASGGSQRHSLVIDHQFRPLFSFFQAQTLPIGIYASEADYDGYAITSELLRQRIDLAAERAVYRLTSPLY